MITLNKSNKIVVSRTLTKMLISYFIVILMSISLISITIYIKFSKATIDDIQTNMQQNLSQNMNQLEIIQNQVYALGMQLVSDSDIVYAMYQNDFDELYKYKATNKLMQVRDSNPMIHSIYVYNSKGKFYLSSFGTSKVEVFNNVMKSLTNRYKDSIRFNFIPLIYSYKNKNGDEQNENIITSIFSDSSEVVFHEAKEGIAFRDSVVIINLKAEYLQKSFTALDSKSDIFLLNKNGDVICDSDFQNFGKNIANSNYIMEILESGKSTGYITGKAGNSRVLYTYSTSKTIPFIFANKSDYSVLLKKVYNLRLNIIMIFVVILLVCCAISVLAAYNVYLPFDALVRNVKLKLPPGADNSTDKITCNELEYLSKVFSNIITRSNELETSIQENIPMVRKMFLRGLLEGDTASVNDVSGKMKEMKLGILDGQICAVLLSIDGYSRNSSLNNDMAQYYMKSKMETIINEELSNAFDMEIVDLEGDLTAVIINVNSESRLKSTLIRGVNRIQERIAGNSGFSVTAAIGRTVDKMENLHLSYANCLELLKYRFVYGYKALLDNNLIETSVNKSYPSIEKNTKKIIQAIRSCDPRQMQAEVDEVIVLITNRQYDYIRLTINQLALDIMKAVEPLINTEDYTMDFNNIFSNINNIDTLEEINEWFTLFCKGIIQKLESKKDNKKKDMLDMMLAYLEENYYKPELSAEMLSELINLTPGYFGKLFNEYMNKTVNEYIVELRMKKAKELLMESTASISEITVKVGFSNQSYFTAIFKKLYGVTPNQYRIDSRKDIMTET